MKVIKHNKDSYPRRVICSDCGSELEYEDSDVLTGPFGCDIISCPVCRTTINVERCAPTLTIQNIKYPRDFSDMAEGAVDIPNEKIQEWMQECLVSLAEDPDSLSGYTFITSGNSIVFAFKFEDAYQVYVAKNYSYATIPLD